MTVNLQRPYSIQITTPEVVTILINPPISVSFRIQRNTLSSTNETRLTIYKLGESLRNQIARDRYTNLNDYWQLIIKGGYENTSLSTLFQGNIVEAASVREGTEWVTNIDASDGIYALQSGNVSMTLDGNTSTGGIIKMLAQNLTGMVGAAISPKFDEEKPTGRGTTLEGNALDLIEEVSGVTPYIDNETLYVLMSDEVLAATTHVIESEHLIGTPRIQKTQLSATVIFSPEVQVKQEVSLTSQVTRLNGFYQIQGLVHDVEISSGNGGKATTTLDLYRGDVLFKKVAATSGPTAKVETKVDTEVETEALATPDTEVPATPQTDSGVGSKTNPIRKQEDNLGTPNQGDSQADRTQADPTQGYSQVDRDSVNSNPTFDDPEPDY